MAVRSGFQEYLEEAIPNLEPLIVSYEVAAVNAQTKAAFNIEINEEIVTKTIDALRRRKIAQSILGEAVQSLDGLEKLSLDSDIICKMFDLRNCKDGSTQKPLVRQLVEKFVVCVYSYSLLKAENEEALKPRTERLEQHFLLTNGTFGSFLDVFFKDFEEATSMQIDVRPDRRAEIGLLNDQTGKNGTAGAAEQNAEQINRLSINGTVWHAVSAFAKEQGKARTTRTPHTHTHTHTHTHKPHARTTPTPMPTPTHARTFPHARAPARAIWRAARRRAGAWCAPSPASTPCGAASATAPG
jgi:hypothetical protein